MRRQEWGAELHSEITCPHCGHRSMEEMPTDACQVLYDCPACDAVLRPKSGDCCVFCSYGSVPCPPVQIEGKGRSGSQEGAMTTLDVYDPAMCCPTGVCGPEVDPVLVRFAADLKWLADQGIAVQRHNLGQEPQAFAANAAVVKELEAGIERLPVIAVDGHIVSTGVYLSRDQLVLKLGLTAEPKPSLGGSCCSPKSGCC